MKGDFAGVGSEALLALAGALDTGRLVPPYGALSIQRFIAAPAVQSVSAGLAAFCEGDFTPRQIAHALRLLAAERVNTMRAGDRTELVWSGPELPGATSRDTAVVARELFESARRTVLVSSYAVYQGKRVLQALAENLDRTPDLHVRLLLNVHRQYSDPRADSELTREFAEKFQTEMWPGRQLPEVFYDPRALSRDPGPRACLHAKCVVVDSEVAFITSANFTEAAHERNIEAGVLLRSVPLAQALTAQFETLIGRGALRRLAGASGDRATRS